MTEQEWFDCRDPAAMLDFLRAKGVTDRKLRHFACACCWQNVRLFRGENRNLSALIAGERFADGEVSVDSLKLVRKRAWGSAGYSTTLSNAFDAAMRAADAAQREVAELADENRVIRSRWSDEGGWTIPPNQARLMREQQEKQAPLLRDIFGNPFRPMSITPAWRSENVLSLARTIYEDRCFDRIPILADALMDAGCFDDEILKHCFAQQPHARGCWLIDSLLGKE